MAPEDERLTVLSVGRDELASGRAMKASLSISTNTSFPTFSRRDLETLKFVFLDAGTNLAIDAALELLPTVFYVHPDGTPTRKFVVLFVP
jgi:hypothetical protein